MSPTVLSTVSADESVESTAIDVDIMKSPTPAAINPAPSTCKLPGSHDDEVQSSSTGLLQTMAKKENFPVNLMTAQTCQQSI